MLPGRLGRVLQLERKHLVGEDLEVLPPDAFADVHVARSDHHVGQAVGREHGVDISVRCVEVAEEALERADVSVVVQHVDDLVLGAVEARETRTIVRLQYSNKNDI
jgi:hypothetical protein